MSAEDSLATMWAKTGVDLTDAEGWTAGTLRASSRTQLLADAARGSSEAAIATSPEHLELGATLGRGGMGLVRLARQGSLRREVAVKTVHDAHDPRARDALLKEAWVGGALEHPNVVPVHTLASADGGPAMVMKRVEGQSLLAYLEQGAKDRSSLDSELRIVIAVCRAIAFAHARGILHLDLKPDNVMLGEFGEVYVVDWGLAVGFGPDAPSWIQPAAQISGVAGTPGYMAPELAASDGASVGPRTDVYLIGGMLHTVLTGEPLHTGGNLMQLLLNAWTSEPRPLPGVPEELASIVWRATARAPEDRFESVDALRVALEAFLRHRLADRLAGAAEEMTRELRAMLDETPPRSDVDVEPRLAGLEQALLQIDSEWAEHPRREALKEARLELRAAHALAQRRPDAAARFLARMRAAPAERVRQLDAVRAELRASEARRGQLEAIGQDLDFTLGARARRWIFGISSVVWLAVSLGLGAATRSQWHPAGYGELLVEGLLLIGVLAPVGWLGRRSFFQNRVNRRLYGGLLLTVLTVQAHWLACAAADVPVMTSVAITSVYYCYAFGTLAFVVDRRLTGGAVAMGITAVATLLAPSWAYDAIGVGGFVACLYTLWRWRSED